MNRTVAIIVTSVTAFVCGIPSCILLCLGAFALLGSQMPEAMAQNPGATPEDVVMGSVMFLCLGGVLLLVPILVGGASFWLSKKKEEDEVEVIDYIPPTS